MDVTSSEPQPVHPRVRTVWLVSALGLTAVVALAAGVALGVWAGPLEGIAAGAGVLLGGSAVAVPWTAAAHRRWRVTLGERALVLEHGVLWHTHSTVPYSRLQHVDVQQGPIESWLGMAQVKLHTASATSDSSIPGLDADGAEELRRFLLERSGTTDAV